MATAEERLMEWLRDAHAMEEQSETMLKHFADRIENYPDIKAQLERHLEQGRQQAARLRTCIEHRGGSTSTTKELLTKFVGMSQGLSGIFVGDEIIKGVMAAYTFEQMGVASTPSWSPPPVWRETPRHGALANRAWPKPVRRPTGTRSG